MQSTTVGEFDADSNHHHSRWINLNMLSWVSGWVCLQKVRTAPIMRKPTVEVKNRDYFCPMNLEEKRKGTVWAHSRHRAKKTCFRRVEGNGQIKK